MSSFAAAFVPLFVAIDAPGVLPTYLGLTKDLDVPARRAVATKAILTGAAVGLVFLVAGEAVFRSLGITRADFRVAGGFILLALALTELLRPAAKSPAVADDVAVVPLGMPLIVGPGAITTVVALADQEGRWATAFAFAANLVVALVLLRRAPRILGFVGESGSRALSKVMHLLLGAIAVSMVRTGLQEILRTTAAG